MTEEVEHDAHVEAGTSGVKITCSCGWSSHVGDVKTSTTKRRAAMSWWYDHYLQTQRAAAQ